ncbi:R-spondin-2-like isoform X2 [Argopecten irradians]|uniref:R-spondin-2-like isoform X2 n=1 Tax=Argopecten irradians TaxID=31199 RepID=UPI00370FCB17
MFLWILVTFHLMVCKLSVRIVTAEDRLKRTVVGHYPACPRGCTSCSRFNGCITCRPRLFLFLERRGMRQRGVCTHSCPSDYYGVRRQEYSVCYHCQIPNCDTCFNRNYCTQCRPPYISYRGRCIERCPNGLHYANYSKDCRMIVDCMVGPWDPWGACTRNGQTCGYTYGIATRNRQVLEHPSSNGISCPALAESRCCRMTMRHCADLLHNNSDLMLEKRKKPFGKRNRRRRRKKKQKYRKRKRGKKRGKKRRRGRKNKRRNRKRLQRKRKQRLQKETWELFCGRGRVYNDIDILSSG